MTAVVDELVDYEKTADPFDPPTWVNADAAKRVSRIQMKPLSEEERREKAVKSYEKYVKRGLYGTAVLDREAWIACEIIKIGWRAANSNIARMWKDLESVIREAVYSPGTITEAGKVQYKVAHGFLFARLPSGRCLAYAAPKLKAQVWAKVLLPDGTWSDAEVMDRDAAERGEIKGTVKIEGATSDKVTFLGVNDK